MEEELLHEYLKRFDREFSLLENEEESAIWVIELTEDSLRKNQQTFANRMLPGGSEDPEAFSVGALIFYGYRIGAVSLKGKAECYTRQGGYMDNAIWTYNLDEILDEETEDDNPDSGASHIIEWSVNPGSNTDVSGDIIGKMMIPLVKNLLRIPPPGKRLECTVVMPPFSKDIEIRDWSSLFAGIKAKELKINIVNYGQLLKFNNNERQYIVLHQTDGSQKYVIVMAYEVIRGHNTCLGCIAFDEENGHQYKLQDIKPISFTIDQREESYDKKPDEKPIIGWDYLDCKYLTNDRLYSFLGHHEASFGRELYKLSGYNDVRYNSSVVKAVFHGNEALQANEICARLVKETNLSNIALGDLVYISSVLRRDQSFRTVSIGTNKAYKLGTFNLFLPNIALNKLHRIPANYASFTWKVRNRSKALVPYFSLDTKKHSEKQIIESVVDHYDHCSTALVADELLYFYKNGEDPSALFVAKVFIYLSRMDSLEIESRNEFVTNTENVDGIKYQEIDKSHIQVSKPVSTVKRNSSIFKKREMNTDISLPIEKMGFTVHTYNCLRRAGIKTAGDITKKTRRDLYKVRNLGKTSLEEVLTKLRILGLKLADG